MGVLLPDSSPRAPRVPTSLGVGLPETGSLKRRRSFSSPRLCLSSKLLTAALGSNFARRQPDFAVGASRQFRFTHSLPASSTSWRLPFYAETGRAPFTVDEGLKPLRCDSPASGLESPRALPAEYLHCAFCINPFALPLGFRCYRGSTARLLAVALPGSMFALLRWR